MLYADFSTLYRSLTALESILPATASIDGPLLENFCTTETLSHQWSQWIPKNCSDTVLIEKANARWSYLQKTPCKETLTKLLDVVKTVTSNYFSIYVPDLLHSFSISNEIDKRTKWEQIFRGWARQTPLETILKEISLDEQSTVAFCHYLSRLNFSDELLKALKKINSLQLRVQVLFDAIQMFSHAQHFEAADSCVDLALREYRKLSDSDRVKDAHLMQAKTLALSLLTSKKLEQNKRLYLLLRPSFHTDSDKLTFWHNVILQLKRNPENQVALNTCLKYLPDAETKKLIHGRTRSS